MWTCFGQFFAHHRERKTVIYSMWYTVPRLLLVGGPECGGTDAAALRTSDRRQSSDNIPHSVNHSIALLMMGKEFPETCWSVLKINKLLLLHLVGPLLYYVNHEVVKSSLIMPWRHIERVAIQWHPFLTSASWAFMDLICLKIFIWWLCNATL